MKKAKALVLAQLGCRLPASTLEWNKIRIARYAFFQPSSLMCEQ